MILSLITEREMENMINERRDEDWINPPEPKENYEPDVDYINDEIWLRKKEQEEQEEIDIEVELDIKKELFDE
jgi:hypothetical protein